MMNLSVNKKVEMSKEGHERLEKKLKNNYQPFVFKYAFSCRVDTDEINCEDKLAKLIFEKGGVGTFVILKNSDSTSGSKGYGYLAKVKITPINEYRFTYEFVTTRGIARYDFWEKKC